MADEVGAAAPRWRRVILKLSGEALSEPSGFGIDPPILAKLAESIKPGSDRIRTSSRLIPNGQSSRLEVDEGVIRLIANAVLLYRDTEFGAAAFDKE